MKGLYLGLSLIAVLGLATHVQAVPMSKETESCLNCHRGLTPGIVAEWEGSRHAKTTPEEAMHKPAHEHRFSAESVGERLMKVSVGCYECHSRNLQKHADGFEHFGFKINVVASSDDCSTCHPDEVKQYRMGKKAHAFGNLRKNPVYSALVASIIGLKTVTDGSASTSPPSLLTEMDACFACHGTELKVKGMKTLKTKLGVIKVPDIEGWPNQGVGRINTDGSLGACTACHPRHGFSIEVARKPYTCSQCHLEPDVPAWDVYAESKHGNIYFSEEGKWDFNAVPWKLGADFKAPTCAACHVSLITGPDGGVIAERSHDFGGRLWVRLFGLIYTHPQPKEGDTSVIKNKDGLPLPTTFAGEPASEFLIDAGEEEVRYGKMKAVCLGCHGSSWVDAHFAKLKNTIKETDGMTRTATLLLSRAWEMKLADPKNPFDEELEQLWIKQWLFYGNSARYASAMTGAPDYVAFKYGWWGLSTNIEEMKGLLEELKELHK